VSADKPWSEHLNDAKSLVADAQAAKDAALQTLKDAGSPVFGQSSSDSPEKVAALSQLIDQLNTVVLEFNSVRERLKARTGETDDILNSDDASRKRPLADGTLPEAKKQRTSDDSVPFRAVEALDYKVDKLGEQMEELHNNIIGHDQDQEDAIKDLLLQNLDQANRQLRKTTQDVVTKARNQIQLKLDDIEEKESNAAEVKGKVDAARQALDETHNLAIPGLRAQIDQQRKRIDDASPIYLPSCSLLTHKKTD
jgi:uncharacterized phage infection (PIP) family protein YhgE